MPRSGSLAARSTRCTAGTSGSRMTSAARSRLPPCASCLRAIRRIAPRQSRPRRTGWLWSNSPSPENPASRSTPGRSGGKDQATPCSPSASCAREAPERPLALIVGADAFLGLPTWHRWRELFDLAHLVVVPRPGVVARRCVAGGPRARVGAPPRGRSRRARATARRRHIRADGHCARHLRQRHSRGACARTCGDCRRARFASGRRFGLY